MPPVRDLCAGVFEFRNKGRKKEGWEALQKMNMEKAAQNMQLWTNDVCASEMTPSLYENHEM